MYKRQQRFKAKPLDGVAEEAGLLRIAGEDRTDGIVSCDFFEPNLRSFCLPQVNFAAVHGLGIIALRLPQPLDKTVFQTGHAFTEDFHRKLHHCLLYTS